MSILVVADHDNAELKPASLNTLGAAVESGTADGILSVAETFTYTGTYTAQQSDIDDNGRNRPDLDRV